MKYVLSLFVVCLVATNVDAQFSTPKKKYRKRSYSTQVKKQSIDPNDSANIYYSLGWDAYKNNDYPAARWFWERGANCNSNESGRWASAFRLGLLHQEGQGVGVNNDIAFYYFTLGWGEGRKEGESEATKNIAACYEIGRGVSVDLKKALEWYEKAKAQGNRNCNSDIARIKNKLRGIY